MMKQKLNDKLVVRETRVVSVKELNEEIKNPESILILEKNSRRAAPLDFGSFVYSERELKLSTHRPEGYRVIRVNPESILEHRKDVLLFVFDQLYCKPVSVATYQSLYHHYRELFNWLDENGHKNAFLDCLSAISAYGAYTKWLKDRVQNGVLRNTSAARRQSFFRKMLLDYFDQAYHEIVHSVDVIETSKAHHRVPDEEEVKLFVRLNYTAANTLREFVLQEQHFPFILETEKFKKYIFPFRSKSSGDRELKLRSLANYETGELRSLDYIRQQFPELNDARSKALLKIAESLLEKNNSNYRSPARLRIASLALVSHIFLIQLITGISPSELREIKYSDVVDPRTGDINVELCSVKRRAAGKKTRYPLGNKIGRKILQDYLRLRTWVLNGNEFEYAFFHMGRDGTYTTIFKQIHYNFAGEGLRRLKDLFENRQVSYIGSSLSRKYKSLIFHELKIPNGTTSALLNHAVATNSIFYAETTKDRSEKEFSRYWQSVRVYARRLAQVDNGNYQSAVSIGAGRCNNFEDPISAFDNPPIKPDCAQQFGCLYCEHYLFHADREDLHKVISLQYVIAEIREHFSHVNFSISLLRDVDVRISHILDQAASLSPQLNEIVTALKSKVFDRGELTVFWENMLTRLEMIWGLSS